MHTLNMYATKIDFILVNNDESSKKRKKFQYPLKKEYTPFFGLLHAYA